MIRFITAFLFFLGFSLAQTTGFTLEPGSQITVQDANGVTIGSGVVEGGTLTLNLIEAASGPIVLVVTDPAGNVSSYQAAIDEDDDDLLEADDIVLLEGDASRDFDDVLETLGIGFVLSAAPFVDMDGNGMMDGDGMDDDMDDDADDGMDDDGDDDDTGDDTGDDDGDDDTGDDDGDDTGDDDGDDDSDDGTGDDDGDDSDDGAGDDDDDDDDDGGDDDDN